LTTKFPQIKIKYDGALTPEDGGGVEEQRVEMCRLRALRPAPRQNIIRPHIPHPHIKTLVTIRKQQRILKSHKSRMQR
jgi:hypothetical protein